MRPNQILCIAGIWIINFNALWLIEPLSQDLSHLGDTLCMRWYLMLWAAGAASYFCVYTRKWMASLEYRNGLGWLVFSFNHLGMVLSVLLPYAPYACATLSKWHTRLTMGSITLYALLVFHISYEPLTRDIAAFQKMTRPYAMLIAFKLLLYLLNGGVPTSLEVCFPMTMPLYLYTTNSSPSRRNRFDK